VSWLYEHRSTRIAGERRTLSDLGPEDTGLVDGLAPAALQRLLIGDRLEAAARCAARWRWRFDS
jgi:hypothetical protein